MLKQTIGTVALAGTFLVAAAAAQADVIRYAVFQMAEVAVPRHLFRRILHLIDDLRPREPAPC